MAVRPVEFQGMVQNTQELSQNQATNQHRPMAQQQHINTLNQQAVELSHSQVSETEQGAQGNYDASKGGDGTGYTGNENRKKEEEKEKKQKVSDGTVKKKNIPASFEISV